MRAINIHEAKTNLSKLVEAAHNGKSFIIAKAGKPFAILGPLAVNKVKRRFGVLKGKIKIAEDFDAPLSEIISDFEGE